MKQLSSTERLKKSIGRICNQTPEEIAKSNYKKLLKRMGIISPKTFIGEMWLGRNELCYCDREPKIKFKYCCWAKHAVLAKDVRTPESKKYGEKIMKYYNRYRRLPDDS